MPSPNERTRNNVRMGIFVSLSLALAVFITVALTDVWATLTKPVDDWIVRFETRSGAPFIKSGSEVRVGGLTLGSVTLVEPVLSDDRRVFQYIDVHFRLDSNITLYTDATILASTQLIGAEGWLDIPHVGTPEAGIPDDRRIIGTKGFGMLTSLLGPAQAQKAGELFDDFHVLVSDVKTFTEFLRIIPEEYHDRIVPVLDDVGETAGIVRREVGDFSETTWPAWRERVDVALVNVERASESADALITDGRTLVSELRAVVDENRPKILAVTENAEAMTSEWRELTAHIREEVMPRVTALLETGESGLDRATAVIARLQEDYEGWSVELGETLANASMTGQQLKLASIEIRRAPWKLLHRPSRDELEHELLYEAARSFALAAAELKAASASVERVLERHHDLVSEDPAVRARLQTNLLDPFERYEKAQQRLLDILFDR